MLALAGLLRPGSAGSNSAPDHIAVLDAALAQLPAAGRDRVLMRLTDADGRQITCLLSPVLDAV